MFKLKKKQLFFPMAAILATAGVIFFVSYGSSQVTNKALLDISLSSDNYESGTRTFSDRSGLNHSAISSVTAVFVGGKYGGVEGAMDFSGGSKYVRVTGDGINAGSWNYPEASFVMWIRPRSVSSTSDQNIVTIENTFEIAINNRNNGFSSVKYASMPWAWRGNSGDNVKNDEWNQIVYTHSNAARKVYVNGEVVYTSSETGYLAAGTASYPYLTIGGRYSGTSAPFDGLIEGVKILNYVLSDEEIKNLYDSGRSVAGLSPVASGGLVGHWSMNSDDYNSLNSRVSDKTPFENHATNDGASFVLDRFGKEGGAMSFDGSGTVDGVVFGSNIVVPESVTDTRNCPDGCTYSLWLNVDTDAVDRMSLFRGSGSIRHIEIYSSGKRFRTEAGLQNGYSFGTGNFPYDVRGTWSHFVIVFANSESGRPVRWYQNGELFHTGYMTNGTYPDTEYFSFGSIGRSTGTTNYSYAQSFDGAIDDVRIYNRALSESEIKSLYNSYNPKTTTGTLQQGLVLDMPLKLDYTKSETAGAEIMTDRTPYSNDGQNYGATITSDSSTFNGSGNRIQLSKSLGIGDNPFTFSHWIKTTQGSGQTYTLGNAGGGSGYRFGIGAGKVAFLIGSSGYTESPCGTLTVNDGEWHMITGVFNRGDKFYCYVDGNLSGSVNILQYPGMNDNAPGIGAPPCCNDFAGEMSNLLIYNRALSGDEVKILYDRGRSDAGIIFTPKN